MFSSLAMSNRSQAMVFHRLENTVLSCSPKNRTSPSPGRRELLANSSRIIWEEHHKKP